MVVLIKEEDMNLKSADDRIRFCQETLIPLIKEIVHESIGNPYSIEKKGHGNYVTDIDIIIENRLKGKLGHILPEAGFLAEESEEFEKIEYEYRWIIDPVDGTSNFIYGYPYAVSVALEHVPSNEIVIGVVYDPENDYVYYAAKSKGGYLLKDGETILLKVKTFEEGEGVAIFGMPYDRRKTKKILDIAGSYYASCSDLKRIGPASLDICMVASGRAKVYFELDLEKWDVAAGLLILTESGGRFRREDDLMIFSAH